jgi:hypothetical protein
MFLAKVDMAALMLHSFSAGITGLLLVYAGVVGDGSPLVHLLSIGLFLVNGGTVLRVLWRGKRRRRRGQTPPHAHHAVQREVAEAPRVPHIPTEATGEGMQTHKTWAWGLLLMVLGLDGVACWAMVWQQDVRTSLGCLLLRVGLLLESYRRWRWGR